MVIPTTPAPSPYTTGPYGAPDAVALVRSYPFATIVSKQLHVTATPILFEHDDSQDTLVGHMHRANSHAASLEQGDPVLAICSGPHAYISPRWYFERPSVPTWNYVMAIVRGTIEPIDDDAGQLEVLRRSAEILEANAETPWQLEHAPDGWVAMLMPRIRSFRIHVESIEGITKLSQAQPMGDRVRVIAGLEALSPEPDLAGLMRNLYAVD